MAKKSRDQGKAPRRGFEFGAGGILKGLGELVEKLSELAEAGQELSQAGEIREGQQVKGIYGFTVKVGLGEEGPRVEPFGNIRTDRQSGRTVVQEAREPVVDIFEEEDHVLIVAEMPGISLEDVRLEVEKDLLTITAERKDKKYRTEVRLPGSFSRERMQASCNNGVLEIKCAR